MNWRITPAPPVPPPYGVNTPYQIRAGGLNSLEMRVFLRDTSTGQYYTGGDEWVADSSLALNLETIQRATRAAFAGKGLALEIVLSYVNPDCELALPVSLDWRTAPAGPVSG